jgi:hypothetical protein
MTMAIISMIEKGKTHGGIPSVIEISVDEAQHLVQEINSLRGDSELQLERYRFKRLVQSFVDARLSFIAKELSDEEKFKILTEWTEGKIGVFFDGVPIRVVINVDANEGHVF